jgi:predicted phosphate transport protein (TIGR00153 family)
MQKHMDAVIGCVRVLPELLDAMAAGDKEAVAQARIRVDDLEHEADELKHDIRLHLPTRLFMAVERRDLLEILTNQDSIADVAQDIAELADLRGMCTPQPLREPFIALVGAAIDTCEQHATIVREFDELVETGFGRNEVARVSEMIDRMNELESLADGKGEDALRALFAIEDELGAGGHYWYEMIRWAGNLADHAERAGNRIRLLIAS